MLKELFRFGGFDLGGRWGEKMAARHLEGLGYSVLVFNYRVKGGEADLIVAKDGLVVAVEVKSRRGRRFGTAAQAVTRAKARRVLLAGRVYCRKNGVSLSKLRGDVVTVEETENSSSLRVEHWPGGLRDS